MRTKHETVVHEVGYHLDYLKKKDKKSYKRLKKKLLKLSNESDKAYRKAVLKKVS